MLYTFRLDLLLFLPFPMNLLWRLCWRVEIRLSLAGDFRRQSSCPPLRSQVGR